jgi:hypothetical protein
MIPIKLMPSSEKYARVVDSLKVYDTVVEPFLHKHIGAEAVSEMQSMREEGLKPIPEDASDEEKYEKAYKNFIWQAKANMSFIRERLGEDGIEKFKRAEADELTKTNSGIAVFMLGMIRAISGSTAFKMIAKQLGYEFQWITPFSMTELTKNKAVYDVPQCKVLEFPDSEDVCAIGCQGIYPIWLAEQLKVDMRFKRQGKSCTVTVTPLR